MHVEAPGIQVAPSIALKLSHALIPHRVHAIAPGGNCECMEIPHCYLIHPPIVELVQLVHPLCAFFFTPYAKHAIGVRTGHPKLIELPLDMRQFPLMDLINAGNLFQFVLKLQRFFLCRCEHFVFYDCLKPEVLSVCLPKSGLLVKALLDESEFECEVVRFQLHDVLLHIFSHFNEFQVF